MFGYGKENIKIFCLLVVCFSFSPSGLQAIQNIGPQASPQTLASAALETQTRGFYNPFQDSFKFMSPANAMLVLNTMLPNVRFKGRYGPQKSQFLCHYQITNPSEGHQPTSEVDCPQDQTSAIVQHFFPSPAGGILRMPALDTIDLLARMDIKATAELLRRYVSHTSKMTPDKTDKEKAAIQEQFLADIEKFFDERLKSLTNDKGALKSLSEQWKNANVNLNDLPKLYAKMFTEAFEERAHYPAHLVEYTLLTYIWKKATKREQLLNLFNDGPLKGFTKPKVKETISPFSEPLYRQWKQESVQNNKLIQNPFQKWLKDPEKLIFMTIGYDLFENPYPKMLDFDTAVYSHATGRVPFPDCGETSVRNFLNFMICSPLTKSFDVNILRKGFPQIRPEVITFYETIQPRYVDVLGIPKDRNAWANSISGLDPQKVGYRNNVCNIKGDGIDNILSVLEELLGDDELKDDAERKSVTPQDKQENRARKLRYIIRKFNEARPDVRVEWSEGGQSHNISDFPIITFTVNRVPVFEWTFKQGHFTFLPIADQKASINWLLNSPIGFKSILQSPLSDDLKRLLLPFYRGSGVLDAYRSNQGEMKEYPELQDYAYEFLFGSPLGGNEQILKALDIALSLNGEAPALKELAKTWIKKSFTIPDEAGDRMLVAFLFQHKSVLGDPTPQDFRERIVQIYQETIDRFTTEAIQNNIKDTKKRFQNLFSIPFASNLILFAIHNWPKQSLWFLKFSEDETILHLACEFGNLPLVEALLNDKEVRQILLSQENIEDKYEKTALNIACLYGHLSVVEALLQDKEASQIFLSPWNIKDDSGKTPLHLASSPDNLLVLEALLKDEQARQILLSSKNIKTRDGSTPLHLASLSRHLPLVEALLKNEQTRQILLSPENIKDKDGRTALHLACLDGSLSIVEALLKDKETREILLRPENIKDKNEMTPLHIACTRNKLSIVETLLQNNEAREILLRPENIKDKNEMTPLDYAPKEVKQSIMRLLEQYSVDKEK